MIWPDSSSVRMTRTTLACASSTVCTRTGPSSSISSARFSAARSDRLLHDLVADRSGDALERDRQVGGLDLAQHQLHRAVVEVDDVLEHEHLAADLLGQLRVALLEALQDQLLGAAVGPVDDLDQRLHAADRGQVARHASELTIRRSRLASTWRMMSGEVRSMMAIRCATSACSSRPRPASTFEASGGRQVRQHQRDRLRVLVGRGTRAAAGRRRSAGTRTAPRTMVGDSRSRIALGPLLRRAPPAAASRRVLDAAARRAEPSARTAARRTRSSTAAETVGGHVADPGDLGRQVLELGVAELAEHLGRAPRSSCRIRMAALRRPVMPASDGRAPGSAVGLGGASACRSRTR